jgi:hypothetical protein
LEEVCIGLTFKEKPPGANMLPGGVAWWIIKLGNTSQALMGMGYLIFT